MFNAFKKFRVSIYRDNNLILRKEFFTLKNTVKFLEDYSNRKEYSDCTFSALWFTKRRNVLPLSLNPEYRRKYASLITKL